MQLGDIAQIRTGLVLSRKKANLKNDIRATYKLLTLKNITDNGMVDMVSLENFASNDNLDDRYFTKEGNILMRLNHPYTAIYIDKGHVGLLIPSYFAIIEVNQTKFFPEYIAWYLNTDIVKKELERSQAGSRIPSTNQNILKTLLVGATNLSKQKALIRLYKLHKKEKLLYEKMIKEKESFFHGVAQQILQNDSRGKHND